MRISLLTMSSGAVEGHRAGCQDVARKVRKLRCELPWTEDFSSKHHAYLEYNADFIAEADGDESNGYDITWLPCADELPDGE